VTSFEGNAEFWKEVAAEARRGAAPTATAMAKYLAERARDVTLRQSSHAPGEWYRQGPRRPPAYATGTLARSMFFVPASSAGGGTAWAEVRNSAEYSRILEFGCVITPTNKKFMHWVDSRGSWYHTLLVVPPHPFIEPTTDDSIRDGTLRYEAIDEFRKYDP
jgi:hypothetical protein